jgi:hypothetical protein
MRGPYVDVLSRLDAAGLIDRKNSANGKRFPLRYGGIIRDAFGIDLNPLMQNHDTLAAESVEGHGESVNACAPSGQRH